MRRTIRRTITRFAIVIVILLGFAGLFTLYAGTLSDERQEEVLIKAIPFVAVFVSILLVYIGMIVILATVLNGKTPPRTYRPIEYIIIAGILLGVLGLFQGWKLFTYENGFVLLLFSVLSFIVWSHVTPMSAVEAKSLPGFTARAKLVGAIAGVVVWLALSVYISSAIKPVEPFGVADRVWDMMMSEEEQQQMRDDFDTEYTTNRIPVAILISMMPGAMVFFATREIVESSQRRSGSITPEPSSPIGVQPSGA